MATPAADDAIAKAAERVQAETNGKVPVINPNSMAALGIEVVDVRIKQINLPAEVSEAIYNRMRAEREAVARRHRSQGQEEAEKLRASADYEVTKTLAESERQARILRGEGDAEAAKLFADAFSQDPDFYAFIRSLRAYENSFQSNQDVMVLSPDSDFFRYMKTPTNPAQVSAAGNRLRFDRPFTRALVFVFRDKTKMNSTIWLALGLVLVLEGLGPMLYPRAWRRMIVTMTQLPDNILRRFGGGLVVAGCVIYYMLSGRTGL